MLSRMAYILVYTDIVHNDGPQVMPRLSRKGSNLSLPVTRAKLWE